MSNGNQNSLQEQSIFLNKSCFQVVDLYFVIISFFNNLWKHSKNQLDIHKTEIRSHDNELLSHQFINENPFLFFLGNDIKLNELLKKKKIIHWDIQFDYIQKVYLNLLKSEFLKDFLKIKNSGLDLKHKFIVDLFKKIIASDEKLHDFYEEININWIDDIPLVNTYILKQLKKNDFKKYFLFDLPNLNDHKIDIDFGIQLFEIVISKDAELQLEVEGRTPNWDSDRIAKLDAILIKMAIAEFIYFKNIPPKVTLNEYLEIAKDYSTPKSNIFINGVLDRLVKDYEINHRLNKEGRGLM